MVLDINQDWQDYTTGKFKHKLFAPFTRLLLLLAQENCSYHSSLSKQAALLPKLLVRYTSEIVVVASHAAYQGLRLCPVCAEVRR